MGIDRIDDYNKLYNFKPMRKPENIEKLNGLGDFSFDSHIYLLSLQSNKDNYTCFFIFEKENRLHSTLMGSNCAYIKVDWENNSFDIKKCSFGNGIKGTKLKTQYFTKEFVRTMNDFVGFVMRCVLDEVENGKFK